ncbi:MAG: response regulator transcription factor [Bacteroidales bacterium]|nr:response regulator transcription factor [Bacteroidales bacterium]
MSKKIPEYLISKAVNCKLLIFVTLFSIVFVNVYTPFEYSTWFNTSSSTLRIIYAVAATIAGVSILAVSRIIMHYVYKKNTLTILQYCIWIVAEIVLIASVYSLFSCFLLDDSREYSDVFQRSITFIALILFIPYTVSYLYFALKDKENKIDDLLTQQKEGTPPAEKEFDGIILFKDEKDTLKLSVKQDCVYFLEAADNYVNIYYLNKNKLNKCMLRNTLKNLEEQLKDKGFIRCHRSYMVNINKIKLIQKEKEGLFINLDLEEADNIPISKTYAEDILQMFSQT